LKQFEFYFRRYHNSKLSLTEETAIYEGETRLEAIEKYIKDVPNGCIDRIVEL